MSLKDAFFKLIDIPFRIRNTIKRKLQSRSLFSNYSNLSDSEVTFYESAVKRIINNEKTFKKFRRLYDYREILEHVDYKLGLEYLKKIQVINSEKLRNFDSFKANDILGSPRTFNFPRIGETSATTLRYVAVASEVEEIFRSQKIESIVEIGGGYGGQALIFEKMSYYIKYSVFDLPDVQLLIKKYLTYFNVRGTSFPDIDSIDSVVSDLVISNYAFSELPRNLQEKYLERVIKYAKNGYLIMNTGKSNSTGRSDGKLSLDELREVLPEIQILKEYPLTGPDNYLIIWKSKS